MSQKREGRRREASEDLVLLTLSPRVLWCFSRVLWPRRSLVPMPFKIYTGEGTLLRSLKLAASDDFWKFKSGNLHHSVAQKVTIVKNWHGRGVFWRCNCVSFGKCRVFLSYFNFHVATVKSAVDMSFLKEVSQKSFVRLSFSQPVSY